MRSISAKSSGAHGHWTEEAARRAAAELGVADFVYTVPDVSKGSGVREVGDALLVSNGRGAVLQVKSRDPEAPPGKAGAWIAKHGEKAYKQGVGSVREIERRRSEGNALVAIPVRAHALAADDQARAGLVLDADPSEWPVIIVMDHADADGVGPPDGERAFWITLHDWHELNRALRSVTGLLIYVERVLEHGDALRLPLGAEQERFARLVEADELYAQEGGPTRRPWLSFDALEDPTGAECYRQLLEGVWPQGRPLPSVPVENVRMVLEFLDATPPGLQVDAGRWILRKRGELKQTGHWSSGAILVERERLLVFACDSGDRYERIEEFDASLAALAALRANEVSEQCGGARPTLAVGHLVDDDGVDYRYMLMPEPLSVPGDLRRLLMHRHGRFDLASGQAVAITAERNDSCPCGSGRKFKYCAAD